MDVEGHSGGRSRHPRRLAEFLRTDAERILSEWSRRVRSMPVAGGLTEGALRDHLPQILEATALCLAAGDVEGCRNGHYPHVHALDRLEEGFDLAEVAHEYAQLRRTVLELWRRENGTLSDADEIIAFDEAIDAAVGAAVGRYASARERSLRAFDAISTAHLQAHDIDEVLATLLGALKDSVPAVDSAGVYLPEGDVLVVRAAVGDAQAHAIGHSIHIGENLAGRAAAESVPIDVEDADTDARVTSSTIQKQCIRAAYAVPMYNERELVAVVVACSETARAFSGEDKVLVRALASRAATLLTLARSVSALRESEEQFRLLVDGIQDYAVFMLDADGRVVTWNSGAERVKGYAADEIVGRHFSVFYLPEDRAAGVPERVLQFAREEGRCHDVRERLRKDGSRFWADVTVFPIYDRGRLRGYAKLTRDITAEKESADELERSEARLRVLADVSQALAEPKLDVQAVLDATCRTASERIGDVCYANLLSDDGGWFRLAALHARDRQTQDAVRTFLDRHPQRADEGLSAQVVTTRRSILRPQLTPADQEALKSVVRPELRPLVERFRPRSLVIVPVTAHGNVRGTLSLARLTEREPYTEADEALLYELGNRAALAMENALLFQQAQEAVRMREDLVAIVSHDLRSPLQAITMTAATLIKREDLDDKSMRAAARMLSAADRASRMLNDLLDFTQARTGGVPIERGPTDLAALLRAVVDEAQHAHPERNIEVTSPWSLRGEWDADRLHQAFANLVGNAVKYSPSDSKISLSLEAEEEEAVIEVHNYGEPIPPDVLPHVFEPYRRGRHTGHAARGLGLGLYIASEIVRAHGGQIAARSSVEGGTTFTIRLPLSPRESRA